MKAGRYRSAGAATLLGTLTVLLVAGCSAAEQSGTGVPTTSAAPSATASAPAASSAAVALSPSPSVPSAPAPASSTEIPAPPTASDSVAAPEPAAAPLPPGGPVTAADVAQAASVVAGMSLPDRAGSVIMASSADAVDSDLVSRLHLGGVILMGSQGSVDGTSGGTPAQVKTVTDDLQSQVPGTQAGAPLLIATDQEYGLVTRLVNGFTDFPGAEELSGISDTSAAVDATEKVTAAAAAELLAVGINVDFAPDADVLPESGSSGVADRSFGSDPQRTGTLVAAAVRGYQRGGVAATIKHFPGIGRLATDTHVALPTLQASCEEWNAVESVPMQAGVDAGVALVMTGHVLLPAVGDTGQSSALTDAVVTDLLRGPGRDGCRGMNFHGVTVSDSFQMAPVANNFGSGEAAALGIAAGQDLVLMPTDPSAAVAGIVNAVGSGTLSAARLQDAATSVYALRLALARSTPPSLDVINSDEHRAIAAAARSAG